ncbi:hypothetical protein Ga0061061_10918 [Chelatococcus sambhunathii]|uniref:Uncharacterized protein n=1 Tax=Chelatococcus sambhunathii TaxID=363953 RepID=A0ABM9U7G0_9HYPH|nr:hypothetical protein [Chelatococcus sambhunathii]CUA89570.1 hypothetical protein Ga0061061_10918 [Chelatococcus sambhunathii]
MIPASVFNNLSLGISMTADHRAPFLPQRPGVGPGNVGSPAFHPPAPEVGARLEEQIREAATFINQMFPETRACSDVAGDAELRRERAVDGARKHRPRHRKIYQVSRKNDDTPDKLPSWDTTHGDPVFRIGADGQPRQVGWRTADGTLKKLGLETGEPKGAGNQIGQPRRGGGRLYETIKWELDHPPPRQSVGSKDSIFLVHPNVAKALGGEIGDPSIQSRIIDAIQKKGIEPVATDFETFAPNVPLSWDFRFDFNGHAPTGAQDLARRDGRRFRDDLALYIYENNRNPHNRPMVIDSATTYILVSDVPHGVIGQAAPGRAYMMIAFNHLDDGVLKHEFGHKYELMHDDDDGVMYPFVRKHQNTNYTNQNKADMVGPLSRALGYDPETGNAPPNG